MTVDPGRAPLANTHVLLVVSKGRVPLVTCGPVPEDPAVWRLSLEVLGHGYGVSVHLRGPVEQLDEILVAAAMALEAATRDASDPPPLLTRPHDWPRDH